MSVALFQSTHPRRVRPPPGYGHLVGASISIHAPAKGATVYSQTITGTTAISIHAPAKGATQDRWPSGYKRESFQSTHPRRVRHDARFSEDGQVEVFQSTHPRRVRRGGERHRIHREISIHAPAKGATAAAASASVLDVISIHAPAKGATCEMGYNLPYKKIISIHAPAKGATRPATRSRRMSSGFQSTHPRRVRRERMDRGACRRPISIHAPAKGATVLDDNAPFQCALGFQSTHPRRVRLGSNRAGLGAAGFQSTHPRRVRPRRAREPVQRVRFQSTHPRRVRRLSPAGDSAPVTYFNPRTREGCDPRSSSPATGTGRFQSTHPRRVRRTILDAPIPLGEFQSTHPRRVRPGRRRACRMGPLISIHAPAKGATWMVFVSSTILQNFNPRTREGCDLNPLRAKSSKGNISIHAPAKGAT